MQIKTDAELLREYALSGSDAAFGEIVRRYADFVYSAALRQVSDPELARDVAQVVFVDLARKAGSLHSNTLLIGWLCRGARLAALEQLRMRHRRQQRERQAMELADTSSETPNDWGAIRPVLDEALAKLGEEDRNALLLRFFKNEGLASVGATLGVSEDAAQKRVSRALGKLREFLAERGIRTTAAALSVALTANGVQAAPAGFAATLAAAVLAKAAAGSSSIPLFNFLTLHHMKTAILSLILAGAVAGLTVQQIKTQRQLHEAQATIRQQSQSLQDLRAAKEQLASQSDELERLRAEAREVVRLRGEIGRLRREPTGEKALVADQSTGSAGQSATNSAASSLCLPSRFVLLPTEDLKALNVAWTQNADGSATGQLNKDQFQVINQALEGASDAKDLGSPRITTGSGHEATLRAFPSTADTNTNLGETLRVLPYYSEDTSTFDLQLTVAFGQWADRSPQQDGSQKEVQLTQAAARVVAAKGQTVVLAKELQNAGWTESDDKVPGPKSLLVFITPAIVHTTSKLARIAHRETAAPQSGPREK